MAQGVDAGSVAEEQGLEEGIELIVELKPAIACSYELYLRCTSPLYPKTSSLHLA
jgi:hypothetical protein